MHNRPFRRLRAGPLNPTTLYLFNNPIRTLNQEYDEIANNVPKIILKKKKKIHKISLKVNKRGKGFLINISI